MRVSPGDAFTLTLPDGQSLHLRATGIVRNYVGHYIYMEPDYYITRFNRGFVPNGLFLRAAPGMPPPLSDLRAHDAVLGVSNTLAARNNLSDQTEALEIVTYVLLVMAGILAFVVLFNLTEINLIERKRELATLKVLGFADIETAFYLYRENAIVTLMGVGAGLAGGVYLNRFILATVEIDMLAFPHIIKPGSFFIAAGLSVFFALLVNIATYYKLARIDMVEALKGVE
jgi:putative ABC transport system permease protein